VLHTLETKQLKPELSSPLNKLVLLIFLLVIIYFGYARYDVHRTEQAEVLSLITTPKVDDIYFLDMKLINNKLGRKDKYKLAKVVRVSDENIAVVYGGVSYQWQYAVVNSIEYGELSNSDYFTLLPEYISFSKIKEMKSNGAIYLVKRPIHNKIYGNFVSPE
jgi:hypothetical protein